MTGDQIYDIERIKSAAAGILKDEIKQLPIVPDIAFKLLTLTNDDNSQFEDLARLIETEPYLSAKILQNVNSAAFALPNPVASVHRAVNLLGFSAVRRSALALILFNRFIRQEAGQAFDPLFFWQHCLFVASLSRRLALALDHPDPDHVYTAGLLHDLGKIVLETYGRRSYSDFISSPNGDSDSLLAKERRFFGVTHPEIGYLLCLEWELPASIAAVVAHHHLGAHASANVEIGTDSALVSFADYIAWLHGIASFRSETQPDLPKHVLEAINIGRLDLERLLQQVDREMLGIREFFGLQFPDIHKLRATLVQTGVTLSQSPPLQPRPVTEVPSSLTIPHQSLDPDLFVPMTLDAIRRDFGLDHVIMLAVDPANRSLVSAYRDSESGPSVRSRGIELPLSASSGALIDCLRKKIPILISEADHPGIAILAQLKINECIAVPILQKDRTTGLLIGDNSISKKPIPQRLLSEIIPVVRQLGIALFNAKQYDEEKKRAQVDPLTQLLNKRALDQSLAELFQQGRSKLEHMAIGFVDIDRFKLFNDTCGHRAGDEIIRTVAEFLTRLTRPDDIIGRYGGEEFLFILNHVNKTGAVSYAERIRSEIERHGTHISPRFNHLPLTVSIGISLYHPSFSNYSEMIEIADQAMYQAKKEGRNRVILLTDINQAG